ncbi:A/G-specific adenine glycosylase [Candidatus Uhrbacteria bacterium]|nr:A/G-specific adenine glycosylase [Candidatus Uhrbacteria bacterium]
MPWRKTTDSYSILVSEIILQQTQVERGIEKYKEFIEKFPSIQALAGASTHDVLKAWSGLGYNRRALFLQKAAKYIIEHCDGVFPVEAGEIEKLPGVGPYTARAVRAFAFDAPEVFIETNIRRIYIHFFFSDVEGISDAQLLPIIQKTLWKKSPREWYSALMDYGSSEFKGVPNPNKRSRHYARQSKFEGSRRQARAVILKNILATENASLSDIQKFLKVRPSLVRYTPDSIVRRILKEMEAEGFLIYKNRKWGIK